jgi:SAM-dependent methyltransferase
MKPRAPLPKGVTLEQVRHHFEVESAIADRLRRATREERKEIYRTMYGELFREVPHHARLARREDEGRTREVNHKKLRLLRRHLDPSVVFVEFAPGDCRFLAEVAPRVRRAVGVDISDQRGEDLRGSRGFRLVLYDGYHLDFDRDSVDLVFSDQLIEHFHPEDTEHHFGLVREILRDGGRYVFRTPHRFSGPHDVSRYFCDEPRGFHLKEWTFLELGEVLERTGYAGWRGSWQARGWTVGMPRAYFRAVEGSLARLPAGAGRVGARYLVPQIVITATK